MRNYYLELDGRTCITTDDNPRWPLEKSLPPVIRNLDGIRRFATVVSAFPEGVDMRTAKDEDFHTTGYLQAGGAADRLHLQLGRLDGEDMLTYNIAFVPTGADDPETERIDHGPGYTMVRPEEVMTWEQALPIFCYYIRNNQTLPPGLWLRRFDKREAAFPVE